jgi:glycosyltransferase involved in cell wall biosynthesis
MNYAKNQLGFLRVLAERPKFFDRVLFIGDTEGAGLSPEGGINARKLALLCEVYAKKHGIPLEITGKLPPEQLLSWYRRARVHAIPALNSYGSVIGEGMACGCPTITWDWWGAETHWPQEMIVATAPMFWQKIQTMTEGGPTTQWNADMMRDWVVTRLDVKVTQEQTDKVIEAVACSGSR